MQPITKMIMGGGFAALGLTTNAALAETGYVSSRTALRAGPGANYPAVATMRRGEEIEVLGCLARWRWCDVVWQGARGWVSGSSIQVMYQSRRAPLLRYGGQIGVPFLNFNVDSYWGEHYRERPFYNQMPRFGGRIDRNDQRPNDRPTSTDPRRNAPTFEQQRERNDERPPARAPRQQTAPQTQSDPQVRPAPQVRPQPEARPEVNRAQPAPPQAAPPTARGQGQQPASAAPGQQPRSAPEGRGPRRPDEGDNGGGRPAGGDNR